MSTLKLWAWFPSLQTGVMLRVTSLWYKCCCFFKQKWLCYHAYYILVSIIIRSPSTLLWIKGLATKYKTVEWPIKIVDWVNFALKTSLKLHLDWSDFEYIAAWGNIFCWIILSLPKYIIMRNSTLAQVQHFTSTVVKVIWI